MNGERKRPEPSGRDMEIYRRLSLGERNCDLAAEYGCSKSNITRIKNRVSEYLSAELADEIKHIRTNHTYRLEHIFGECLRGWERSKSDKLVTTEELAAPDYDGEEAKTEKTVIRRERRDGNTQFLALAKETLSDIRRIWGADRGAPPEEVKRWQGMSQGEMIEREKREKLKQLQELEELEKKLQGASTEAGTAE